MSTHRPHPDAPLHPFAIAHHRVGARDHCYKLRLGARPLFVCARCLGIFVSFVPLVTLHLVGALAWFQWAPALWLLVLPAPAVVDWSAARLGWREGSNPVRTSTGLLLGAGQAAAYCTLFADPLSPWLWSAVAVHGGAVVAVHLFTRARAQRLLGQERRA